MPMTLGERIRHARQHYGMSQAELARRIGVSKTTMNNIEMGETTDPGFSHVLHIAETLHLSLDALAGRDDVAYAWSAVEMPQT